MNAATKNQETVDVAKMAQDHWRYVAGVMSVHGVDDREIIICGHHYREAFAHGYKHAIEDVNAGKTTMRLVAINCGTVTAPDKEAAAFEGSLADLVPRRPIDGVNS